MPVEFRGKRIGSPVVTLLGMLSVFQNARTGRKKRCCVNRERSEPRSAVHRRSASTDLGKVDLDGHCLSDEPRTITFYGCRVADIAVLNSRSVFAVVRSVDQYSRPTDGNPATLTHRATTEVSPVPVDCMVPARKLVHTPRSPTMCRL
jgi:hypothetical protein